MANDAPTIAAFKQALRLIQKRACAGATIEQILGSVHISRQSLERYFIQRLGRTPRQELDRIRIVQAQKLLISTSLPVKRIGFMVGFRNKSNFSAYFRRQTGRTPTAYRQSYTSNASSEGSAEQEKYYMNLQSCTLRSENHPFDDASTTPFSVAFSRVGVIL
jgi:transcriptional regulator GlxA family with amidase domain